MPQHRITLAGSAARAAAELAGEPFILSAMVLGSGQHPSTDVIDNATALADFQVRIPLTSRREGVSPQQIVVEALVPVSVGGFDLLEVGLETADGVLYAYSTVPLKRLVENNDGTSRLTLEFILQETNSDALTIIIDEGIVYATRPYVDESIAALRDKTTIVNSVSTAISTFNNLRLAFDGDFEPNTYYHHTIGITVVMSLSTFPENSQYAVTLTTSGFLSLEEERIYAVNALPDPSVPTMSKRWSMTTSQVSQGLPSDLLAAVRIYRFIDSGDDILQAVIVSIDVESVPL